MKTIFFAITLFALVSCQQLASDEDFAQTGLQLYFECVDKEFKFGEEHACEVKLVNEGNSALKLVLLDTPLNDRHSVMMNQYLFAYPKSQYKAIRSHQVR